MKVLLFTLLTMLNVVTYGNIVAPHILTYTLFGYGLNLGTEVRTLTLEDNTYIYVAKAQTEGLAKFIKDYKVVATSTFNAQIAGGTFHSIEYDGKDIKKQIHLISHDEIITNIITGKTWKRSRDTFDFLNVFLALAADFKEGNPLIYDIANGKKIKTYAFENKGIVNMNIQGESIATVKLVADTLEVFIAEKYDYLPVLIHKEDWKYTLQNYTQ